MFRFLVLFALALPLFAQKQPNVLFLFADDQRADTIAAWGNSNIQTPNLDRLVRTGYSFRNNYCLGGNSGAVCVFSRAMLNSGKAYFRIPMDLDGEKTLGEQLRAAGYRTYGTGKWHNQRPAWLDHAHRVLDEAVAAAYGWPADLQDEEVLRRLLALNLERSASAPQRPHPEVSDVLESANRPLE